MGENAQTMYTMLYEQFKETLTVTLMCVLFLHRLWTQHSIKCGSTIKGLNENSETHIAAVGGNYRVVIQSRSPRPMQLYPLDNVCGIHPGPGLLSISGKNILEVKVIVPPLGTQLKHQFQRCALSHCPGAAPLPKPESMGKKGKENKRWRGSWRKTFFSPSPQLGRLWSGWFIQDSSDRSRPQPHQAKLTSPPPTLASWVMCYTWPTCWGRAGPSLLLPFRLAWLSGQPKSSSQEHWGMGNALDLPGELISTLSHLHTDMHITHRYTVTHTQRLRGLPVCST